MGQTLSSPSTEKKTENGGDAQYLYAVSEMQGWRISMEDAHTVVLNLEEGSAKQNSFFAVYDGHGGSAAAKFAGINVHRYLTDDDAYRSEDWKLALKSAFLTTDEHMNKDPSHTRDPSGCTAVAGLITHDRKLFVANAGDSRSVICVKGEVKALSFDHKPQNDDEKMRILSAGGYVEYGRVNGNLALSRALGDFEYKTNLSLGPEKQIITCDPEITEHQLTEEDEFFVIACDGIWDCLSSQQVVDMIRRQVAEGKELGEIAENMCDHCLAPDTTSGAGIGCDNMTVLIIALLNGKTKEEWYAWVKERVESKYGYDTPVDPPQIFAQSRLMAFRARRQAMAERDDRDRAAGRTNGSGSGLAGGLAGFGGLARVLGSTGGITFHPGSGLMSDQGGLMFEKYDDSDEETDEEMDVDIPGGTRSFFAESFGGPRPTVDGEPDADEGGSATKTLRAQLDELSKDDEAAKPADVNGPQPPTASAPSSEPGGDAPHPVTKAEGLLDKSEDPLKVSA